MISLGREWGCFWTSIIKQGDDNIDIGRDKYLLHHAGIGQTHLSLNQHAG